MSDIKKKISELSSDGFVMFRQFLSPELVKQAHDEIASWYEKDLEERSVNAIQDAHYDSVAGHTILTKPSHLMIDVYGKSPILDQLVDKILTDPLTAGVLKALVGKDIDFYGYNIRLMTGTYDPAPAHEFHRDSPGEVGIGILLTDVAEDKESATALVPGSHLYPYCPRWNTLFKNACANYHSLDKKRRNLITFLPFNRLLARKINKKATGAFGKRGDVYFFINDTWHGRQPNLTGKKSMVMLIGGAPTDMHLHHTINPLSEEVAKALPASVRKAFCDRNKEVDSNQPSIIKDLLQKRSKSKCTPLFYLARLERKWMDKIFK